MKSSHRVVHCVRRLFLFPYFSDGMRADAAFVRIRHAMCGKPSERFASMYIGQITLTDTVMGYMMDLGGKAMDENKMTSDLLRGHTDTMILRLLSEDDRYGYEIVKLIAQRSGGRYQLKEATMYSGLRRLEADGDITWYWGDESRGGRRKYFKITEKGKDTYIRNKGNWEYAKRVLEDLL